MTPKVRNLKRVLMLISDLKVIPYKPINPKLFEIGYISTLTQFHLSSLYRRKAG